MWKHDDSFGYKQNGKINNFSPSSLKSYLRKTNAHNSNWIPKNTLNEKIRPVLTDCQVGNWSNWSECVRGVTCAESYQMRERVILQQNTNGGKECPALIERRRCHIGNCSWKNKQSMSLTILKKWHKNFLIKKKN